MTSQVRDKNTINTSQVNDRKINSTSQVREKNMNNKQVRGSMIHRQG